MMYNIELNIADLDVRLLNALRNIGKSNDFKVSNHGDDRLVFESDSDMNFTKLVDELANCCEAYGVNYVGLLDLY